MIFYQSCLLVQTTICCFKYRELTKRGNHFELGYTWIINFLILICVFIIWAGVAFPKSHFISIFTSEPCHILFIDALHSIGFPLRCTLMLFYLTKTPAHALRRSSHLIFILAWLVLHSIHFAFQLFNSELVLSSPDNLLEVHLFTLVIEVDPWLSLLQRDAMKGALSNHKFVIAAESVNTIMMHALLL